jgi:penicillin-binding protein 1A
VDLLENVVSGGTGESAATGDFAWGKTGTTDDNGDAWFCGGTEDITACVWVGYADSYTPMKTEFAGGPVDGGTYPALIWHDIVTAYESIIGSAKEEDKGDKAPASSTTEDVPPATTTPTAPAPVEPAAPAPTEPAPTEEPAAPPEDAAPAPAAPPTDGGTGTGATGASG